jgi:hypothetical protein
LATGGIVFLLALPLAVIFVGAFDRRIYDLDDVRRLGVSALGHVARFEGDNIGALKSRRADGG